MLDILGHPFGCCDGISRRSFLRAGFLGLAGVGLPQLLRARAAAGRPGDDTAVILFWLEGGPSHMDTYDPKPDAPAEFRGPFKPIQTVVPGINVCELLPRHARVMDKLSVIRSVRHDNGDHYAGAHWMLTGYYGSNGSSPDPMYPCMGSVAAKVRGPNRPGMPAYVAVPRASSFGMRPGYLGAAYLGVAYHPFDVGADPGSPGFQVKNLNLPAGVGLERLDERRAVLASFDHVRRDVDSSGVMQGMDSFTSQAFEMITGAAARQAFDLSREDPRIRDKYGRHTWGQSALLARRLIEAGVTFVTINAGGWDHHAQIKPALDRKLPPLDDAVASLTEDLFDRGLLDKVMIVVMGEFGRTPRVNQGAGRDHWGNCMSVLVGGGGLKGGRTLGCSSAKGEYPVERPIAPEDVVATIYHRLGIDRERVFINRAGRPIPVLSAGTPIHELL